MKPLAKSRLELFLKTNEETASPKIKEEEVTSKFTGISSYDEIISFFNEQTMSAGTSFTPSEIKRVSIKSQRKSRVNEANHVVGTPCASLTTVSSLNESKNSNMTVNKVQNRNSNIQQNKRPIILLKSYLNKQFKALADVDQNKTYVKFDDKFRTLFNLFIEDELNAEAYTLIFFSKFHSNRFLTLGFYSI